MPEPLTPDEAFAVCDALLDAEVGGFDPSGAGYESNLRRARAKLEQVSTVGSGAEIGFGPGQTPPPLTKQGLRGANLPEREIDVEEVFWPYYRREERIGAFASRAEAYKALYERALSDLEALEQANLANSGAPASGQVAEPTLADFRQWLDRAMADSSPLACRYSVALSILDEFVGVAARFQAREAAEQAEDAPQARLALDRL